MIHVRMAAPVCTSHISDSGVHTVFECKISVSVHISAVQIAATTSPSQRCDRRRLRGAPRRLHRAVALLLAQARAQHHVHLLHLPEEGPLRLQLLLELAEAFAHVGPLVLACSTGVHTPTSTAPENTKNSEEASITRVRGSAGVSPKRGAHAS